MRDGYALNSVIWDEPAVANDPAKPWKILVVDDDIDIQRVTELAISRSRFLDRPVELISADSFEAARSALDEHADIAVALVDVNMETDEAGLQTVQYIRETQNNSIMRVLLRTAAPLDDIDTVRRYDVDGVLHKAEVTHAQLFAAIHTALRTFRLLREQERYIDELGALIDELRHFNTALVKELREPMERMCGQSEVMTSYLKLVLDSHRNDDRQSTL